MEDLFRTLPSLLRAAGESKEVCEAVTLVAWRRIAGEGLRGQAVPCRLLGKTLVVAVADTTWKKQLEAVSGELLFRLNSVLGRPVVTYIEFRVDMKIVRVERDSIATRTNQNAIDERQLLLTTSGEVSRAAKSICDEELRHQFLIAAGSCIERKEKEASLTK